MGTIHSVSSLPPQVKVPIPSSEKKNAQKLIEIAQSSPAAALQQLNSRAEGLQESEASARLLQYGPNEIAGEKRRTIWVRLWAMVKNPLVILLSALALISFLTGDLRATIVILSMVVLGVVLRFFQEMRADTAAEQLKAMVSTTATVLRSEAKREVPLKELVPG